MDKYLEHSNEDYSEFISKSNDSDESINNEDKEARELADILTDNTAKRKAKVRKQREKNRKRMVEMKLQCPHCQTVYKEEEKNIIRRGLGEYPARANMQYWGRRKTKTRGGVQRYYCKTCGKRFTIKTKNFRMRHPYSFIIAAKKLSKQGLNCRDISKKLKVSHVTVSRWLLGRRRGKRGNLSGNNGNNGNNGNHNIMVKNG